MFENKKSISFLDRIFQGFWIISLPISAISALLCLMTGGFFWAIMAAALIFVAAEECRRYWPFLFDESSTWHEICWISWGVVGIGLVVDAIVEDRALAAVFWTLLALVRFSVILKERSKWLSS